MKRRRVTRNRLKQHAQSQKYKNTKRALKNADRESRRQAFNKYASERTTRKIAKQEVNKIKAKQKAMVSGVRTAGTSVPLTVAAFKTESVTNDPNESLLVNDTSIQQVGGGSNNYGQYGNTGVGSR